jgi:hypothetical protein
LGSEFNDHLDNNSNFVQEYIDIVLHSLQEELEKIKNERYEEIDVTEKEIYK